MRWLNVHTRWSYNEVVDRTYKVIVQQSMVCIAGILRDVHSNFVAQFDYPVIVFHEPDFTVSLQDEIKRTVPDLDLYFQLVKFTVSSPFFASIF